MQIHNHHISLITQDADQNIAFYTKVLGLRLIKNSINQNNAHRRHIYYGDFVGSPGTVVTFFPVNFHGRERLDRGNFYEGIGFNVPKGSLVFWAERLTTLGIDFSEEVDHLVFADGDGIPLTLFESTLVRASEWTANIISEIPTEMQILGIRSTRMVVQEPAATAKFFADLFDLPTENNRVLVNQDEYIDLVQADASEEKLQWGPGAIDHFALGVDSSAELNAVWQRGGEIGYEQEFRADRGYFRSIYFREPNDNRVEIATNGPGFTLDESIETLGSTFSLPPAFEARRDELTDYFSRHGVLFDDVAPIDLVDRDY
jgi:catechol 2,3-dioxygenase-like lactoylglutathione lyase family enzyme